MYPEQELTITIPTKEYKELIASDVFRQMILNAYHAMRFDSDVIDVIKAFIGNEPKESADA